MVPLIEVIRVSHSAMMLRIKLPHPEEDGNDEHAGIQAGCLELIHRTTWQVSLRNGVPGREQPVAPEN